MLNIVYWPSKLVLNPVRYSIFGIGVDRKHEAKRFFPQEKATFHYSRKATCIPKML
jgi:hypothetical protein